MKLDGKVALITGAARGIGEAIARKFVADGCKVVITDIDQDRLETTLKSMAAGKVAACNGDVTKINDVNKMVQETIRFGGKIDVLVNNAGVDYPKGNIVDLSVDDWKSILDVNLTGPFCA